MSGKEDPKRNFGSVGHGSSLTEKVEEEFKVGVVPSAFVPLPLPPGRHKRGKKKADYMSNLMLRPCTGGHAPTEGKGKGKKADLVHGCLRTCAGVHTPTEEEVTADWVSGGLRPCAGRHILAEEGKAVTGGLAEEKDAVTGGKRKVEESEGAVAGGFSDGGKAADVRASADVVDDGEDEAMEEWMEMPVDYLAWILSKTREERYVPPIKDVCDPEIPQEEVNRRNKLYRKINERVQVANDEFFRFQAWVRDTLERNGRVMIPADTFDPAPEVEAEINQIWRDVMKERGVDITKLT